MVDPERGARVDNTTGRAARPTLREEITDAITGRAVAMILGVLAVQLLFIASYVAASHAPTPHRISLDIVAPGSEAAAVVSQLNSVAGHPVDARAAASEAQGRADVRTDRVAAALVVSGSGTGDELLIASGGGSALASAVEKIATAAESSRNRTLTVTDLVPLQSGDGRGLTGFYLVIGWIVGGYLMASLLGVSRGSRPANLRRAAIRLGAMAIYALLSGLLGTLIVDQGLGALRGHFAALFGIGCLVVMAAAAVTLALQVIAGVIGIGLTVLLFVVGGNPSAGGAYQTPLLPAFWRFLSGVLPNGAATDAVRRTVYFAGAGITSRLLVISAWLVGGAAVALVVSHLKEEPVG